MFWPFITTFLTPEVENCILVRDTCRPHAFTEFKDWLWLTAEIRWMITRIQLPIVSQSTYKRVIGKFEENK